MNTRHLVRALALAACIIANSSMPWSKAHADAQTGIPHIAAPTVRGANLPAKMPDLSLLKPQHSGILDCDAQETTCVVRAMPLLHQSDPDLDAPMDSFLAPILALDPLPVLDANGEESKDAAGNPIYFTTQEIRQTIKGFACYDTSIVTVIHTALANRGKDAPPLVNRTLQFDQAKRWSEFSSSKTLRQQVLQNYWAFLGQNELADSDASPVGVPQPLFFHEVAADLGGGIKEACDPYIYRACSVATGKNGWTSAFSIGTGKGKPVTNETIIDRMKAGYVTMVSYVRYDPKPRTAVRSVETAFEFTGHHKVVFAGFQPGPYPLLVYDVGDGQPYKARLSNDIGELKFDATIGVVKIGPSDLLSFAEASGRPFLIYENEDLATNPQVKFVENYEGLRVAPPTPTFKEPVIAPSKRLVPTPEPMPAPTLTPTRR